MNHGEIRNVLSQAVRDVPFVKEGEEQALLRIGGILAAPEKGVENYRLYQERCAGRGFDKSLLKLNHWEMYAADLAAAVFCSMVYGNNSRFVLDTRKEDVAVRVWNYVSKRKWDVLVAKLQEIGVRDDDMEKLNAEMRWLFSSVVLRTLGTYTIYIDSNFGVLAFDSLVRKAYPANYLKSDTDSCGFKKDRRHPFLAHVEDEFYYSGSVQARGRLEQRDIFLQMMNGLAACAGK